jgi:acetyl-CoA synthetase
MMEETMATTFDVKLESKSYKPDPSYREQSWIGDFATAYQRFLDDPEGFWAAAAGELEWYRPWERVKEWNYPYAKWFSGAKLNITHNCLDRHVAGHRRNKVAIIWRGEKEGDERILTYRQLYRQVMRFASALSKLGVKKGDTICLYMPLVPEQIVAMLACARIGAVHSIVYGGFGAAALNARIRDAKAKIVITADVGYRRGKHVSLKTIVDEAVVNAPSVERIIVLRRTVPQLELYSEMEEDFYEVMEKGDSLCDPEVMDAEDPLFILYTSGTTGPPKGIVHTCAGYMVGTYYTTKYVFDVKDSDVHWCTADPGWITGHSYIVYGPLAAGATVLITETTPDYPDPGIWWRIIEEFGVTIFYTAPTAIRMFMKYGDEWPATANLDSLRIIGSVGEPLNPEAFEWYYHQIGKTACPIIDTWWQTETGMILITPLPGVTTTKPGSATKPFPGVSAGVVNESGERVEHGGGYLVIDRPWPAMTRGIYGDDARFRATYWERFPGLYFAGDGARIDADGDYWLLGRVDDVMNVSGHRISTIEVESALVDHPSVAEAAVCGRADAITGQAIVAFVTLKGGEEGSVERLEELRSHVAAKIGPIAKPANVVFTPELPKTRSGKIMRRLLRDVAENRPLGDTTTLADPAVVHELSERATEAPSDD